mmetsp:Transcript_116307/g.335970  ORF Transcript_116307/g.335970 Transcript_116307/m.335970 type:complete len:544 (+) Transcript_116307:219-1850(+)
MASMAGEGSMPNQSAMSGQEHRPALRRATYVHVSDLTNVYNIDHAMLEQELKRVKDARERGVEGSEPKSEIPDEEVDPELESSPQKRLQPPRGGYNLCVLVGKVTLVVDKKRVDQSRVRLAEVEIGDETGTVSLRARDEQIDLLDHVSSQSGAVVLRNCTLELFQGKHIRLAVTKWGKLSVYPDNVASTPPAPSKINYDRNFSEIDLSVVASEMVEEPPESYARAKQSDQQDTGNRPAGPKGGQKHQQSQPSGRRGGREKRQSKGKQGAASFDHAAMAQPYGQIRYTAVHPYQAYEIDPRQFPYPRQQDHMMASASAQQMMLQRQYELQQHQLRQMYHSQQDQDRAGMPPPTHQSQSSGMMMQPIVPVGSFDTAEYHAPSYSSTTSSPILIPMAMPGTHGPSNLPLRGQPTEQRRRGDGHGSATAAHEPSTPQYMSVSPDDSSQFSARMNPEATAFSPSYMAQGNQPTGHQMYLHYDPSNPSQAFPPPQSLHQPMYAGMMYVPPATPEHQHGDHSDLKQPPRASGDQSQVKRSQSKGKENVDG